MPRYDEDYFKELVFALGYLQHGGSGLGWTPSEVLDLPVSDASWYVSRLVKARKADADAIKKAAKPRGTK